MAISDNLVGWWSPSLDDAGNGTTTLTDLTDNGNNGTLTNMDAATDWVADTDSGGVRALDFDGVDDFIIAPMSVFGSIWSLSLWVRSAVGFDTAPATVVFQVNGSDTTNPLIIVYVSDTSGGNGVRIFANGSTSINQNDSTIDPSQWHHCAITSNSSGSFAYINGAEVDSGASIPISAVIDSLRIGNWSRGQRFRGAVDQIAIWDRELAQSEITEIYDGGRSFDLLGAVETATNIFNGGPLNNPIFSGGIIQ